MGTLRRGEVPFELSAATRIGRDPDNELAIDSPSVSQFHAVIRWTGAGEWEVRDLGSTNGTAVDGVLLKPGDSSPLRPASRLSFGDLAHTWTLADAGRPLPEARDVVSGERLFGALHLISLGGEGGEVIDIFEEDRGSWVIEREGAIAAVKHGQQVVVGGRTYRLSLPLPAPETEESAGLRPPAVVEPLGQASVDFYISADLETVRMNVHWADRSWECERAYNRALLELARARLRDRQATKLPPVEHGWIYGDELCTLADYDGLNRLNVEIHRARHDLARNGVPNGQAIIQRRRGTGQLRIGTDRITIVEGARR